MTQIKVRASALNGWATCLHDSGYEGAIVSELMSSTLPPAAPQDAIPLKSFVAFSEQVAARCRDVAVPWLVGVNYDVNALWQVGSAVSASPSVGTALRRLVDYFALLQDCTDIRLERDERMAVLSYRILDPDIWPRHHDAMFSLGIVAQIVRKGTRGAWENVEFQFEAGQEEVRGDMSQIVSAPCSFGAETNAIRFPAAFLDCKLEPLFPDAALRQLNDSFVSRRRARPISERLAEVVFRDLDRFAIDQSRVAREIGMSSRTMRRKLAGEGSSFQQVLDECRMRQAVFEFRTKPHLSIAQIALRLGYSEHSTFTRAFHRWSSVSPQEYRARLESRIN